MTRLGVSVGLAWLAQVAHADCYAERFAQCYSGDVGDYMGEVRLPAGAGLRLAEEQVACVRYPHPTKPDKTKSTQWRCRKGTLQYIQTFSFKSSCYEEATVIENASFIEATTDVCPIGQNAPDAPTGDNDTPAPPAPSSGAPPDSGPKGAAVFYVYEPFATVTVTVDGVHTLTSIAWNQNGIIHKPLCGSVEPGGSTLALSAGTHSASWDGESVSFEVKEGECTLVNVGPFGNPGSHGYKK